MKTIEQMIESKAKELKYEKCGIVRIGDLAGYDEKLEERMQKVPQSTPYYQNLKRLTHLAEQYPWARSVIVAIRTYGEYKVPKDIVGIGKAYLLDSRVAKESDGYKGSQEMEKFLQELGLKTAGNRNIGLVALRWAALKAGLGTIRRNNFFYTESGSWVTIEAWITERDMELIQTNTLPPCPEGCRRCIDACPTGSLSAPYTMLPVTCVSFLTTFDAHDFPSNPLTKQFRTWIYGCDACQDACPMNHGKWKGVKDFPGLDAIAERLSPEEILNIDDEFYTQYIQPRFFFFKPDELWKWKVAALNFMRNNYQESYKPCIIAACSDAHENVREMAGHINDELFGNDR
jgi:Uncharacterized Fe-S protein